MALISSLGVMDFTPSAMPSSWSNWSARHKSSTSAAGSGAPCDHPEPVAVPARYRPRLAEGPVSQVAAFDAAAPSAFAATNLPLASRRPAVGLLSGQPPTKDNWLAQPDLLQSLPEDRHFTVETEADGSARLRFGDDQNGRRPASGTTATWRGGLVQAPCGRSPAGASSTIAPLPADARARFQ